MIKLYNTLTRRVQDFKPLNPLKVTLYTCGPTVYDYTHIGHLKTYTGNDILKRTLKASGFEVEHVMNITDVGHLTSDADEGDDKLDQKARERGQSVWDVAKFFEDYFFKSTDALNILRPNIVANATKHINEQIKLIEQLVKKGYTYQTEQAIYFDTSKFSGYGKLSGQKMEEKVIGAREDVVVDSDKKHPADFALWFFTRGRFSNHTMRWSSPWGEGFPGWHIECSAMSMEYLGDTLDIHTGGVDHIPVHHENEIAQSEAVTGQSFVRFWVHHEHLLVDGRKMSKSLKNFYTIDDITQKGFDPLALRYLFLTSHYRDRLNFTWKSLEAAQNALQNLRETVRQWSEPKIGCAEFEKQFMEDLNNDLNMPQALAVMWELIKSDYPDSAKAQTLLKMDEVLGLELDQYLGKPLEVPEEVKKLVNQREQARNKREFDKADKLRKNIEKLGYEIEDTPRGARLKRLK